MGLLNRAVSVVCNRRHQQHRSALGIAHRTLWVPLLVLGAFSAAEPAAAASPAPASTESLSDVSVAVSTSAGGATGVTWTVTFKTPATVSSGDFTNLSVTGPTGTYFSYDDFDEDIPNVYPYYLSDSVNGTHEMVYTANESTFSDNEVTLDSLPELAPNDTVTLTIPSVTNPAAGQPFAGVTVSSTGDVTPAAASTPGGFVPAGSVSKVNFAPSTAAGGALATWTVKFETSSTGQMVSDLGTSGTGPSGSAGYLQVAAPAGTNLPSGSDFEISDSLNGASGDGVGSAYEGTLYIGIPIAVAADDTVTLTIPGVVNPPSGSFSGVKVSTTSDPTFVAASNPGAFPASGVPAAPASLTATAGLKQVELTWPASVSDGSPLNGYEVFEGSAPGAESATPLDPTTISTSYAVTGLTGGVTYYFTVEAYNGDGASAPSPEARATTLETSAANPPSPGSSSSPSSPPVPGSSASAGVSQTDTGFTGYVEGPGSYSSSTATFTLPTVSCSSTGDAYYEASVYNDTVATESGVQASCTGTTASYLLLFDLNGTFSSGAVVPAGDTFVATASNSGGTCRDSVRDTTAGQTYTVSAACSDADTLASAGAQTGGSVPRFSPVTMSAVNIDGTPLQVSKVSRWNSYNGSTLQVTQGDYRTGSFVLTWVHL